MSFWAANSFRVSSAAQHNLSLHARVAPGPDLQGTLSQTDEPRRPSRGHNEQEINFETPQIEAMGQWLLGVAQDLLDPELYSAAESPGTAVGADLKVRKKSWERLVGSSGWRAGTSGRRIRMTPRQRFEFLAQQVQRTQQHCRVTIKIFFYQLLFSATDCFLTFSTDPLSFSPKTVFPIFPITLKFKSWCFRCAK